MPRIVSKFFDPLFSARRDALAATARLHLPRYQDELVAVAQWLESEYSEAKAQEALEKRLAEYRKRDNGQVMVSHWTASSHRPVKRCSLPGDSLRADRLELALTALLSANRPGQYLRVLGGNIPRGERESNALRAIVVCCCILDPDAGDWLTNVTELAGTPLAGDANGEPPIKGRADVAELWGREALGLLEEASRVLNWSIATVDTHQQTSLEKTAMRTGDQDDRSSLRGHMPATPLHDAEMQKLANNPQLKAMAKAHRREETAKEAAFKAAQPLSDAIDKYIGRGELTEEEFRKYEALVNEKQLVIRREFEEHGFVYSGHRSSPANVYDEGGRTLAASTKEIATSGTQQNLLESRLIDFLADQPHQRVAIVDLPEELLDVNLLTVMGADGLIEFGCRGSCSANGKTYVDKRWDFYSFATPDCRPLADLIYEALHWTEDERIRPHVQLTAKGRVEVTFPPKSDPRSVLVCRGSRRSRSCVGSVIQQKRS